MPSKAKRKPKAKPLPPRWSMRCEAATLVIDETGDKRLDHEYRVYDGAELVAKFKRQALAIAYVNAMNELSR